MTVRLAQVLLVAAAVGLWVASRLPWVTVRVFDGLGQPRTVTLTGSAWSTALVPMAVLLLASALAALAVRRWPLRIVAVLVTAASAAAAYLAVSQWVIGDLAVRAATLAQVPVASLVGSQRYYGGAAVALVAAGCALLGAVLLIRGAGRRSDQVKYATPTQRGTVTARKDGRDPMTERMLWDVLDEGRDPTRDLPPEGR